MRALPGVVALVFLVTGCDPAASAVTLEPTGRVPGLARLFTAVLDGEAPLVLQLGSSGEDDVLWRWDGAAWRSAIDLTGQRASLAGLVTDRLGGAWLLVRREAQDGSTNSRWARVRDGVVTETPESPGLLMLGSRPDGSVLVSDGATTTWRLPPGGAAFEPFSTDADLAQWTGVILDDGRLANPRSDGIYVFDAVGTKRKAVPCGELYCAQDTPGLGLVGGQPHMVFGSVLTTEYVITRVDLETGAFTQVGKIDHRSPGNAVTFTAQIQQLAVTEKRWYAVRAEDYSSSADGWLVHNSLDGAGEPVLVSNTLTLGGALLVSPKAIWAYEPRERRLSRLPR